MDTQQRVKEENMDFKMYWDTRDGTAVLTVVFPTTQGETKKAEFFGRLVNTEPAKKDERQGELFSC